MKKTIILVGLVVLASLLIADWETGDGHKMHFPQLPDPTGWDIGTYNEWFIADDWQCSNSGPVDDMHFWISWNDDATEPIISLRLIIMSNNPSGPQGFSIPENVLWDRTFYDTDFTVAGPWTGDQGWYDVWVPQYNEHDHINYYQVNIENIDQPFTQTDGEIYWLVLGTSQMSLGWKTSQDHFMDNAVWGSAPISSAVWYEIYDPVTSDDIDLAFVINDGDPPTPVELSSFTAVYHNGTPTLNWTTQSETNNIGWNVYRSENNILEDAFQVNSNLINGAGTTFEPTEYTFIDENSVEINSTYFYWIENRDTSGNTGTHDPISLTIPDINNDDPNAPNIEISSIYNYPNPFSNSTKIGFSMKESGNLDVTIYDSKGQLIKTLYKGHFSQQDFIKVWDAKDSNGKEVSSGIYMYVIKTDENNHTGKMILTK